MSYRDLQAAGASELARLEAQPKRYPAAPDDSEAGVLWRSLAGEMRAAIGDDLFDVWLGPCRPVAVRKADGVLGIGAPGENVGWLNDRFRPLCERLAGRPVVFVELQYEDAA